MGLLHKKLKGWWSLADNAPKTTARALPTFFRMVDEAERQLKTVQIIISKLRRDGKIKLK